MPKCYSLQKLVTAAWAGNVEEVELCLLNDANIDYKDVGKIVTI